MLALCCACAPRDGRERRDWERMRRQQRYNAFGASSVFRNGAVMQPPPPHTIETRLPVAPPPITDSLIGLGAKQYFISCLPCHGAGGYGGGPMANNLADKRPSSLRVPPASVLTDSALFHVITDGFGAMPPHGWQMPADLRWAVVAYVRQIAAIPATPATRDDALNASALARIDSIRAANKALAKSAQGALNR